MNSNQLNTLIFIAIIAIVSFLYYQYNNQNNNQNNLLETFEDAPTSTFNMKQFYQSTPPLGSKVESKTVSYDFPQPIDKDVILGKNKSFQFTNDKYSIQKLNNNNADTHELRFSINDKTKDDKLTVYGGACDTSDGCKGQGSKLFQVEGTGNVFVKQDLDVGGKITGKIPSLDKLQSNLDNMDSKITNLSQTQLMNQQNQQPTQSPTDTVLEGKDPYYYVWKDKKNSNKLYQLDKDGNQWNKGHINAKDVNVRGRIYFSNATDAPRDRIIDPHDPNFYKVGGPVGSGRIRDPTYRIHDSDPFYIEKIRRGADANTLRITINDNGGGNDTLEVWGNSCGAGDCRKSDGFKIFALGSGGAMETYGNGVRRMRVDEHGQLFMYGDGGHQTLKLDKTGALALYMKNKKVFQVGSNGDLYLKGGIYPNFKGLQ